MRNTIKDAKENDMDEAFSPEQQKVIMQHLMITKQLNLNVKNYSHVPCKFFKSGKCQAGEHCKFSHQTNILTSANLIPCKYYKKGHCKFGNNCVNSHDLSQVQTPNDSIKNANSNTNFHLPDYDSIASTYIGSASDNMLNSGNANVSLGNPYEFNENFIRNRNSSFSSSANSSIPNNYVLYNPNRAEITSPISSVSSSTSWQKSANMESKLPQTTPNSSMYSSTRPNTPSTYTNYHSERFPSRLSSSNYNFANQIKEEEEILKYADPNYNKISQYSPYFGYQGQPNYSRTANNCFSPVIRQKQELNFLANYKNVPVSPTSPTAQYPIQTNDFNFENHNIQLEDTLFFFDDF